MKSAFTGRGQMMMLDHPKGIKEGFKEKDNF